MADDIKVRIGTPEDIDGVMELLFLACEENGLSHPDPTKILHEIYPALLLDQGIVGVIGKPGERLEGIIVLRVSGIWYSSQAVLDEKLVFVHPDFRGAKGGRASKLCKFAKEAADKLGLPLTIGVLSNDRTEAKMRLYERQFGPPAGVFFLYKCKTGGWKEVT